MSVSKLQEVVAKIEADGIGVFLPVMQTLLSTVKEHVAEDNATTTTDSATTEALSTLQKEHANLQAVHTELLDLDNSRKTQVEQLEAEVKVLQDEIAGLKAAEAVKPVVTEKPAAVVSEPVKDEQEQKAATVEVPAEQTAPAKHENVVEKAVHHLL